MFGFIVATALGAAAAYFFDPQSGRGRRARLRDQAMSRARRGAEHAEGMGRDAANRAQGFAHEAADAVRGEEKVAS